jgi:hypothetical protein
MDIAFVLQASARVVVAGIFQDDILVVRLLQESVFEI